MISKIKTLKEYNEIFIERIISSDLFLPIDDITLDALHNNRIDSLREIVENRNTNEYSYYSDLYLYFHSPLTPSFIVSSPLSDSIIPYLYPYSKTAFISSFYPDVFPSLLNHVFNYMKQTGRMIHIGQGAGKALILYPTLFSESDFEFLIPTSYSEVVSSTVNVVSIITQQQADIAYLLKTNTELTLQIEELTNLNNNIQRMREQEYLTTWR